MSGRAEFEPWAAFFGLAGPILSRFLKSWYFSEDRAIPGISDKDRESADQEGLSWEAAREAVGRLAQSVEQDYRPQHILAISVEGTAGGLLVGALLAEHLHIPVVEVVLKEDANGERHYSRTVSKAGVGGQVLLVDDITFTGDTLKEAIRGVSQDVPDVEIRCGVLVTHRVLVHRRSRAKDRPFKPHYFAHITEKASYEMPWGKMSPSGKLG